MNVFERSELQNRMIKNMRARTGEITYFGPGPVRSFLYAIAVELQHLYYRLFRVDLKQDPLKALGSDLDAIGVSRGLARLGASAASAVLEFTGTIGTTIPVGFQVRDAAGVVYQTTESGVIAANTLASSVNGLKKLVAQSVVTGAASQSERGSLNSMVNAANVTGGTLVSVTNPGPSVGGADIESDDQYRSRIISYLSALNQGTRVFYEAQVRSIDPSVVRVYVSKGLGAHTVNVYPVSRSGATYTSPQLTAIAAGLGPVTPVQVSVNVQNLSYTSIDIAFTGTVKNGFTATDVLNNVAYNISNFLDWSVWGFGTTVQWDDLLALASNSDGVDKISPGTFTPSMDTAVAVNSLPKLTSITFTDATSQAVSSFTAISTEFPRLT